MFIAANSGHVEAIETLYKLGANVNTPDRMGNTPLMAASSYRAFLTLYSFGANIGASNRAGETVIDRFDDSEVRKFFEQEMQRRLKTFLMGTLRRSGRATLLTGVPFDVLGIIASAVVQTKKLK
eukprot:c949_g1_i2.p1 GENE.c949_g1_i2~~c949_g1_i2.p1  ORF type:complete len:124 (+),score=22.94 c949_g1_i2:644-1015(+)